MDVNKDYDVKNFLNQAVHKSGGFITKPTYEIKEKKENNDFKKKTDRMKK